MVKSLEQTGGGYLMQISAKEMRIDILKMALVAKGTGAHLGGSLSLVEIFSSLYSFINFDKRNLEKRDRIILSKGHGVMAQYAALKQLGLYTQDEIETFKTKNAVVYAHPYIDEMRAIDFSSGSLGQGLSLGIGVAIAQKLKKQNKKTYVILGDGECNEGQVWEAAMSAAHYKLNNLVAIIDKNNIQLDDKTSVILDMGNLAQKWESFGFDVIECDGHNESELLKAYNNQKDKPLVIIANTIKGKGVSFMKHEPSWHFNVLSQSLYEKAMCEVLNA